MQALIDFDGWRQWKDYQGSGNNLSVNGSGKNASIKEDTEEERVKREKKEAKRAQILAKMG